MWGGNGQKELYIHVGGPLFVLPLLASASLRGPVLPGD